MKIEIDLSDVLHDENGYPSETLAETIRRQVVETIKREAAKDIQKQISETVSVVLDAELSAAIKEQMPSIVANLMEAEYVPIDRYGGRGKPTTFRQELVKKIHEEMTYVKRDYGEKNAFTKAVDQTVSDLLGGFKTAFQKQVDADFTREAMALATATLKKRLGVA